MKTTNNKTACEMIRKETAGLPVARVNKIQITAGELKGLTLDYITETIYGYYLAEQINLKTGLIMNSQYINYCDADRIPVLKIYEIDYLQFGSIYSMKVGANSFKDAETYFLNKYPSVKITGTLEVAKL